MTPPSILVTGQFVADEHVYESAEDLDPVRQGPPLHAARELAGAGLVHALLQALAPKDGWTSHLPDPIPPHARRVSIWRPNSRGGSPAYWGVVDSVIVPAASDGGSDQIGLAAMMADPPAATIAPTVAVVWGSEAAGDRETRSSNALTEAEWVVFHLTNRLSADDWPPVPEPRRRLVAVVSADHLRTMPVRLGRGVSWEDTIQDLVRGLQSSGGLEGLTRCRHLVVRFGSEGAVWLDLGGGSDALATEVRAHLVYDARTVEGDSDGAAVPGADACIVAAIARQIVSTAATGTTDGVDLVPALDAGLCGMRDLLQKGHGPAQESASGFPARRLARAMNAKPFVFSRATFLASDVEEPGWSLLRQSQRGARPAYELARLVLLRGAIALANLPHVRLGPYTTADRHEAEVVRRLLHLARRYARQDTTKPLSIGVFGPPGAGKSFAVKQLAKSIPKSEWLEFNLSQWHDANELIGALHRVRDAALEGLLPVAFFDEFDAQSYMWLKHLLAPMQDGRFQDGQIVHPLGKCILVFAGGTSWTRETFGPPQPDPLSGDEPAANREFRLAKGTDFISRLDDYLDVVGPNARRVVTARATQPPAGAEFAGGRWWASDPQDLLFPVRRALMIRAELRCADDERLDIDEGLVHALLHVENYTHGARSLTKLLRPLTIARPAPLRRSMLPPSGQLALHVDAERFLRLCHEAPDTPAALAAPDAQALLVMATSTHETYRALGRSEGWLDAKIDKPYAALDEFTKASNRAAAARMLAMLPLVGLTVEPGQATAEEDAAVRAHLEYRLDVLAQEEHDGWMALHFSQGWRYAPITDERQRLHTCLRPYAQLPLVETGKDRNAIRHYPEIARAAGMKIAFAEPRE